jgi:hypothetical protein
MQRQCHRFERGQVEPLGSKVNVEADDLAPLVEVDDDAVGYLARLGARGRLELDIEAVRLRVINEASLRLVLEVHRGRSSESVTRRASQSASSTPE